MDEGNNKFQKSDEHIFKCIHGENFRCWLEFTRNTPVGNKQTEGEQQHGNEEKSLQVSEKCFIFIISGSPIFLAQFFNFFTMSEYDFRCILKDPQLFVMQNRVPVSL